jgi:hypothetical protein
LTRLDQEIYDHLVTAFPDFDVEEPLREDEMKSSEGKARWREFMMKYEKAVCAEGVGELGGGEC